MSDIKEAILKLDCEVFHVVSRLDQEQEIAKFLSKGYEQIYYSCDSNLSQNPNEIIIEDDIGNRTSLIVVDGDYIIKNLAWGLVLSVNEEDLEEMFMPGELTFVDEEDEDAQ